MRRKSLWDIPDVACFLLGLGFVLIGLAAATWHVLGWMRTNRWQAASDGEMMVQFGYGEARLGWGTWQGAVDWLWAAPFWAVTLAIGVIVIYFPSLLRGVFGIR